jgi:tetratricopeptide (TPR) repeat protein/tRNA A-37 threonylcarbamoyl transferase component Bud32
VVGKRISHYRILELISEGGMGAVYRAEDLTLGRTVAIKVVRAPGRDPEAAGRRFLREAQAASRIDHPNVITVFEVLQEDGINYLVMQYLEGESLRAILNQRQFSVAEALKVGCQIAAGVEAAHRLGVVHRDLKPENVMASRDGTCKVVDFGVAHLADHSTLAEPGALIGTVPYMAPEQVRGEAVDARTDVYSLGVMLFEMLTGSLPHRGTEEVALLYEILNRPAPSLQSLRPDLPEDLSRVVAQALCLKPADRYADVSALLHDLELIRARYSEPASDVRARLLARRRRRWGVFAAAGIAGALAVVGLMQFLGRSGPAPVRRGPRVMVMRWDSSLTEPQWGWLSGGVMDCLIRALGGRDGLSVISRETAGATLESLGAVGALPSHSAVVAAAHRVGARYLVTGSLVPHGSDVRVVCDLTDLRKGVLVRSWSRDLADPSLEFYPVVDDFAAAIAREMGTTGLRAGARAGGVGQQLTASMEALSLFQQGREFRELGNWPAALDLMRRAAALDSTFTDAQLFLSRITHDRAERTEALARAMASRSRAAPGIRALVEAEDLVFRRQLGAAERKYAGILAQDPENVMAGLSLGNLYIESRRFEDAVAVFVALHRTTPYDFSFYAGWATALIETGRRDRALALLEDWRRQFPGEAAPLRNLIHFREVLGDYRVALALCDSLDRLQPGAATTFRGFLLYDLGRMKEAKRTLRGALVSPDPFLAAARGNSYLAYMALAEGRHAEGLKLMEPALRATPGTYNYWLAGLLAAGNGELDRATSYADAVAREFVPLGPDSAVQEAYGERRFYHHLRGHIALARKDPAGAVRAFTQALRYTSRADAPFFRTDLGRALIAGGDPARAALELRKALDFNPNYPPALLDLGRAYLALGRKPDARRVLERLRSLWREADREYAPNGDLQRMWRECG